MQARNQLTKAVKEKHIEASKKEKRLRKRIYDEEVKRALIFI